MWLQRLSGSPGFLTMTAVACLATAVACGSGAPPELNGLTDQVAQVGVELKVDLFGTDPDGDQLSYSYQAAGLNLDGHAGISISPSGSGVFRWTPLAKEVGEHSFDFTVSDGGNDTTVTISIDVKSAIGAATAPLFRQPLGTGTTLDLAQNECLELDILVEDQDTAQVTLAQEEPIIEGSKLDQTGGQTAAWSWCPTRAQESEDRYTLKLSADDGENPKITKNYLIVLRSGTGTNCPGNAPVITHTAADRLTILDLNVSAAVTDDKGIKNEPLIYYSITPPADPPDLGAMTQLSMARDSGTNVDGMYSVALPNPVATAPQGTSATVYYVIAAKDDDDEVGGCDHTTTSQTYSMKVTSNGVADAGLCVPCSHDSQCGEGDLCVRMGSMNDTYCLQACTGACPSGYSCSGQPLSSIDGASDYQCVPQSGSCDAPTAPCEDDIWEENDERSQASANPSLIANNEYPLVSCPSATTNEADNDWFKIVPPAEGKLTVQLTGGANTDLDLRLYRSDGTIITSSTSLNSDEQIMTCLPPLTYYVRVFGWGHAKNEYTLTYSSAPQACSTTCADDSNEDDDTYSQGRFTTLPFSSAGNAICPGDDDFYSVRLVTGDVMKVDLTFNQVTSAGDLDLHLFKGAADLTPCEVGVPNSSCSQAEGQGAISNESTTFTTPAGCESGCDYSVVVHGFNGSANTYSISIQLL